MTLHRRNPRRDGNEATIIEVLRRCGWSVQALSIRGGPDLLLGRHGDTVVAEVKQPKGRLRDAQAAWHEAWRGSPVIVLRTVEEALALSNRQLAGLP